MKKKSRFCFCNFLGGREGGVKEQCHFYKLNAKFPFLEKKKKVVLSKISLRIGKGQICMMYVLMMK